MAAAGKNQQIVLLENNFRGSQKQMTIASTAQIKETKKLIKQNGETVEIVTLTLGNAPVFTPMMGSGGEAVTSSDAAQAITLPLESTIYLNNPDIVTPVKGGNNTSNSVKKTSNILPKIIQHPRPAKQIIIDGSKSIDDSIAASVTAAADGNLSLETVKTGATADTAESETTSHAVTSALIMDHDMPKVQQSDLIVHTSTSSNTSSGIINGQSGKSNIYIFACSFLYILPFTFTKSPARSRAASI